MAADGMQRLDLKDLGAVLERAKAEGWTELALVAGSRGTSRASYHYSPAQTHVCVANEPLKQVPDVLCELAHLKPLDLTGDQIRDTGAEALARPTGRTSLGLMRNQIGSVGLRATLDACAHPSTTDRRRFLYLHNNVDIGGSMPKRVLQQTDAQALIWRQHKWQAAREASP